MNWSRYGSPLTFSFSVLQHTTFSTPLLLGLYGLLISPGKGLLLLHPDRVGGPDRSRIDVAAVASRGGVICPNHCGRDRFLCGVRILDRRLELGAALYPADCAAADFGGGRLGARQSDQGCDARSWAG